MIRSDQRQRSARIFYWVSGVLVLAFCGFMAYHFWFHKHDQDLERVRKMNEAKLAPVEHADPGNWPQFGGPTRDGTSYEKDLLLDWPEEGPKELWSARVETAYSSMAIANGHVVTMGQEGEQDAVLCFAEKDGKKLWSTPYAKHYTDGEGSGPRSTPSIDGDRVYAVGAEGTLLCMALKDGKEIWRKNLMSEFQASVPKWGVSFSPLIDGDLLFIQPGGGNGNSLVALKKSDGSVHWKKENDAPSYSSPILMESEGIRQVLFFTGTSLVSLDPQTGSLHWRFEWETMHNCNIATPLVRGNYVFISSNYGKGCAVVEVEKKGDRLEAHQVWRDNKAMNNHFSTSVIHDRYVYGFNNNFLSCVELDGGKSNPDQAGEIIWEAQKWKSRAVKKGSLIGAQGHLIVFGGDGTLFLVKATPEKIDVKSSFRVSQVGSGRGWCVPALANGRLYVRDDRELHCYDLSVKPGKD